MIIIIVRAPKSLSSTKNTQNSVYSMKQCCTDCGRLFLYHRIMYKFKTYHKRDRIFGLQDVDIMLDASQPIEASAMVLK